MEPESLESQIDRLANFIMAEVPGEPSQSEGAVDTAIRWMRAALASPPVDSDAVRALRLYDIYDRMPSDRGGKNGPRGKAYTAFVEAKDAALSAGSQGSGSDA